MLMRGLEGLMVSHNEKAVSGSYNIFKEASHINNFGGFLGGLGTLAEVRVCSPEVRALQLGSLPRSTASEGHLGRASKEITKRETANNRIFKFAMNLQIWQLESVSTLVVCRD